MKEKSVSLSEAHIEAARRQSEWQVISEIVNDAFLQKNQEN